MLSGGSVTYSPSGNKIRKFGVCSTARMSCADVHSQREHLEAEPLVVWLHILISETCSGVVQSSGPLLEREAGGLQGELATRNLGRP